MWGGKFASSVAIANKRHDLLYLKWQGQFKRVTITQLQSAAMLDTNSIIYDNQGTRDAYLSMKVSSKIGRYRKGFTHSVISSMFEYLTNAAWRDWLPSCSNGLDITHPNKKHQQFDCCFIFFFKLNATFKINEDMIFKIERNQFRSGKKGYHKLRL